MPMAGAAVQQCEAGVAPERAPKCRMSTPQNKWKLAGVYALGALILGVSLDRFLCSEMDPENWTSC